MTDIPWDEMPEWADVWVEDLRSYRDGSGWHRRDNEKWVDCDGWSFFVSSEDEGIINVHCPPKPQWRGPEDGLPPVGVECMAVVDAYSHTRCVILAYHDDMVWLSVDNDKRHPIRMIDHCKFKPLPTKRDQWVEKAERYFDKGDGTYQSVVREIHDALLSGELPVPEQE